MPGIRRHERGRIPARGCRDKVIELRQVQEMSDFPADMQKAAAKFPERQKKTANR
jgi:hypothetical protein